MSNWIPPHSVNHSDSLLALLIKLLKPSGKLVLKDTKDITLSLKLNGFINVTQDSDNVYIAEKPNFEVIVLHQYSYEYLNYFFFSFNKPIKIFNRMLKCDLKVFTYMLDLLKFLIYIKKNEYFAIIC